MKLTGYFQLDDTCIHGPFSWNTVFELEGSSLWKLGHRGTSNVAPRARTEEQVTAGKAWIVQAGSFSCFTPWHLRVLSKVWIRVLAQNVLWCVWTIVANSVKSHNFNITHFELQSWFETMKIKYWIPLKGFSERKLELSMWDLLFWSLRIISFAVQEFLPASGGSRCWCFSESNSCQIWAE